MNMNDVIVTKTPLRQCQQLIDDGALLIDVRNPQEFTSGHLENALNIPLDQLPQWLTEQPTSQAMVLYCGIGKRAQMGCNLLAQAGFTAVYNGGAAQDLSALK
ncbi:rhodanese-like domain-containing protein [Shewanella sp. NIFS-20-20]|uniref:rhodanese-like domain-containing protein n=1 Tax=Shewanella sp. NIFS-20-20 TaxID=2853806 RepID=UPI001C4543E2|nr:rhodanese-like domain-containing protein [Shewanella sp. NIFS-20-20]MBV7315620.1 rhodanese-like domain-containing protein [Shewanella sp. NIFS-20-20]